MPRKKGIKFVYVPGNLNKKRWEWWCCPVWPHDAVAGTNFFVILPGFQWYQVAASTMAALITKKRGWSVECWIFKFQESDVSSCALPGRLFHSFWGSKFVDRHDLWRLETSIDGIWSFNILKSFVGCVTHASHILSVYKVHTGSK